ncbi:uncharacterized protein LY89DRAFT_326710 [Mollisia scopiformis]|uniref:Uncharacterized protein n=1 Tax=Mollisia scopiformis TaxID=149040 RepID=A0A132B9Y6_MOLSC|nr:uncharacterized protein LY89DRAFT_326710 [Mollisia scopiformis]KUJ08809.1 hypothetical protein LY89DRAFT_326710 [Mollisia scopiformis]
MKSYATQQQAIGEMALSKGITLEEVHKYFASSLTSSIRETPGPSDDWHLSRAEHRVWKHFFPGEPFPGKIQLPILVTSTMAKSATEIEPGTKAEPVIKTEPLVDTTNRRSTRIVTPSNSRTDQDWVHDRYDSDIEERLPRGEDLYRPGYTDKAKPNDSSLRLPREADYYRPKPVENPRTCENFGRLSRPDLDMNTDMGTVIRSGSSLGYVSMRNLIETKYRARGIPESRFTRIWHETATRVAMKYSHESSDWQRWAKEKRVWDRLFESRFPGIEPARQEVMALSSGLPENPPRSGTYQPQEKVMEQLAMRQGIRHEFFQFLQQARDQARANHGGCSNEIRHFYADRMTWMKFFRDHPFQGVEPEEGHGAMCKAKQAKGFSPPTGPSSRSQQVFRATPAVSYQSGTTPGTLQQKYRLALVPASTTQIGRQLDLNARPSVPPLNMLLALDGVRKEYNRPKDDGAGLIMTSQGPTFCDARKVVEVWRFFTKEGCKPLAAIGEELKCALHFMKSDEERQLLLWATPAVGCGDNITALNRGQAFLQGVSYDTSSSDI